MRSRTVAVLVFAQALAGCLVMRVGGGAVLERPSGVSGRFEAELGLVAPPVTWRGDQYLLRGLVLHRASDVDRIGWDLGAVEATRWIGPVCHPLSWFAPPAAGERDCGPGVQDVGVRLEVGRGEQGRYVGAALESTYRIYGPWALTGVISAGANTGPSAGPSMGVHLLLDVPLFFF